MLFNQTGTGAVKHIKAADQRAEEQEEKSQSVSKTQKDTKTEQYGRNADSDKQQFIHAVPRISAERQKTGFSFSFFLKKVFHIVNPIPWFRNIPLYIIV